MGNDNTGALTWGAIFEQLKQSGAPEEAVTSAQMSKLLMELHCTQDRVRRFEREEQRRKAAERDRLRKEEEQRRQEEHIRSVTSMELPMDWENVFSADVRTEGIHADSAADALIVSLTSLGRVDVEYMAAITGMTCKAVIEALGTAIYQNPETWDECFYKGWETAEEYLSGNLMRKRKAAEKANHTYRGYFERNLLAIDAALPAKISKKDIYVTLGSPWVPPDIIDAFITYILKIPKEPFEGTTYDPITGSWNIPNKSGWYSFKLEATHIYGTLNLSALQILERTLNMKTVKVTQEVPCAHTKSGKKRVIHERETAAALEKQGKLIRTFQEWVWKDPTRRMRLETVFEEQFGCVRTRRFDGSFLNFPTMSPQVTLYPYQKNAVARILFSPNTLLAHDVGSGKTYIMIAAGMELRRMGLSKKNLYVVPNNIVGQWKSIFETMYPTAKVLCVEPQSFRPSKRDEMLETIRDEDFDAVIMAYSCFEQIPLSRQHCQDVLQQEKERIEKALSGSASSSRLTHKKKKLEELIETIDGWFDEIGDTICFDELGITRLFVDEAHNFKNVSIETKVDRVLGISPKGSRKCDEMLEKVHAVQQQNNGGGVVMATGTPITNSITDVFVMQRYLQSGELALLDLQNFDSWIGMFAEKVTEFEIDVDTSTYRLATRFAKFHNLPELTALLSSVADFHAVGVSDGVPQVEAYTDVQIRKTTAFERYLQDISRRADDVRNGIVPRTQDNMLKITGDGRKAALDVRLVDPSAVFDTDSKVAACAQQVWETYVRTADAKSTQLVFCDTSTPKAGLNMYSELKRLLVGMGIPETEMAFVHHADTERKRATLFRQVRQGAVRVLIGSTFKLGIGVNVQDKLIAVHHLDVPWRPADMTQREGRILRQGNENPKVQIYRYITQGSFDAYSWQLLETKQRFITGILSGCLTDRSGGDIDDTVLSYAEVKAIAVGNPLMKERVQTANELNRLITLRHKTMEERAHLEHEQQELPERCRRQDECIEKAMADAAFYQDNARVYDKKERAVIRQRIFEAISSDEPRQRETVLLSYQDFDVVLPAGMTSDKPYVWLQRKGRYYVELSDAKAGCLVRIDHVLDTLDKHIRTLQQDRQWLGERMTAVEQSLARQENYADRIEKLMKKLERIDKELGVDTP